jgi:DNA modification methylase
MESLQGLLSNEDGEPLALLVNSSGFAGAHFATFPPKLVEPMILAGTPTGGTILDPFFGAGTVGMVAERLGRRWVGIELNPEYCRMAMERIEPISRQGKFIW